MLLHSARERLSPSPLCCFTASSPSLCLSVVLSSRSFLSFPAGAPSDGAHEGGLGATLERILPPPGEDACDPPPDPCQLPPGQPVREVQPHAAGARGRRALGFWARATFSRVSSPRAKAYSCLLGSSSCPNNKCAFLKS